MFLVGIKKKDLQLNQMLMKPIGISFTIFLYLLHKYLFLGKSIDY